MPLETGQPRQDRGTGSRIRQGIRGRGHARTRTAWRAGFARTAVPRRRNMTASSVKIVIIGGVAGGANVATRARRLSEHAEIVLIERGPHISFANFGLPYHIGGEDSP